jgi:hypothetical protein
MAINPNDKSEIKNLCDYPVSWERKTITGDEYLKANATTYITNAEIETQINNDNPFLKGTDDIGSHASVYINNPELRESLGFDSKEEKRVQLIVDDKKCEEILALKTPSAFKKNLESNIVTNQEKMKIMNVARKIKLNSYDKIQELEKYCDIPFNTK